MPGLGALLLDETESSSEFVWCKSCNVEHIMHQPGFPRSATRNSARLRKSSSERSRTWRPTAPVRPWIVTKYGHLGGRPLALGVPMSPWSPPTPLPRRLPSPAPPTRAESPATPPSGDSPAPPHSAHSPASTVVLRQPAEARPVQIAEITRVLRSGGVLVGSTFLRYTPSTPWIILPFRQVHL
ncbi:hypothetical protein EUGRSUZ_E02617 [Eucalyptus grandis]|uniref:Uncharacterized protein n=1 Tax=Eucalyptus grandis TaxID=71139 RepID=A0ACC3KXP0_EUCGR|nr:hypothetical protein EUGRSUZ_E02617 [Eucalyptus grandis]